MLQSKQTPVSRSKVQTWSIGVYCVGPHFVHGMQMSVYDPGLYFPATAGVAGGKPPGPAGMAGTPPTMPGRFLYVPGAHLTQYPDSVAVLLHPMRSLPFGHVEHRSQVLSLIALHRMLMNEPTSHPWQSSHFVLNVPGILLYRPVSHDVHGSSPLPKPRPGVSTSVPVREPSSVHDGRSEPAWHDSQGWQRKPLLLLNGLVSTA